MANPTPRKLAEEMVERDGGLCQRCFDKGVVIHHIVYGGTGRKRIHRIENLITLCLFCHKKAHSEKTMREWTYRWSREKYGPVVDELLKEKWMITL